MRKRVGEDLEKNVFLDAKKQAVSREQIFGGGEIYGTGIGLSKRRTWCHIIEQAWHCGVH
jgi:hypothetical protein